MAAETKKETIDPAAGLQSRAAPIIERAPLPTVEVQGKAHLVTYVNSAFCRLLGKSREELIGKPFAKIVCGGIQCEPILDQVYQTGEAVTHAQPDDSEPEPASWLFAMWPALDENERPVGVIIQLTRAATFRQNAAAINEALLIAGLHQHELTETAEKLNAQLRREITERKLAEAALQEVKDRLADQAWELERVVAQRTASLTAANQQMESFIFTVAHDLRAPLRAMQGFSSMLVEEARTALSETGRNFADRINRSAQFMDALLRDLLAFSQLSQAGIELAPVSLEKVVSETVSRLQGEIQEKNAQVEALAPWPTVLAHEPTLGQVLTNLVSNALKFVQPGVPAVIRLRAEEREEGMEGTEGMVGLVDQWMSEEHRPASQPSSNPTIQQSIHPPTLHPRPSVVRVWVTDNGIGIAPEHQKQIFYPFARLHGESYGGTGIGLAIVQKGVQRMGGRVGLESAPGQGSRFWFELRKA